MPHPPLRAIRQLALYGAIGCLASGLDFAAFTLLTRCLAVHYLAANCCSVLLGISVSFTLNRLLTFRVRDHARRRFAIFLTVGLCGLAASNAILWAAVSLLHLGKLTAKLVSIALVVGGQFLANKHVTFRQETR